MFLRLISVRYDFFFGKKVKFHLPSRWLTFLNSKTLVKRQQSNQGNTLHYSQVIVTDNKRQNSESGSYRSITII